MSLDSTWRLLQRQGIFEHHPAFLFVNPPADALVQSPHSSWRLYAHERAYQAPGTLLPSEQVSAHFEYTTQCDAAVVFLPKEKKLSDFILAQLAHQLPLHTQVYIVGPNDGGIRSFAKKAIPGFAPLQKVGSGNHCQLLTTELVHQQDFVAEQHLKKQNIVFQERQYPLAFLPGVFGEGRLDAGTAFFLEHMPASVSGRVLDFGCGSGVISYWLQQHRNLEHMMAADLSTLATSAAAHTLAACQTPYEVRLSDGFYAISETFDWIVTNPPFHQGKATDYEITSRFIAELKQHLNPGGQVVMVANSFLPWPNLLQASFQHVQTLAKNNRFTITLAR
ncbi:hypothetical protein CWE15_05990 [Aliidiomarina taiwanensis]|uniref:Uncharacterized protein n=1 Tax=Aliidiomarina taiwanensis TaxID=946228 RepID=A0A432X7Z1_9GAMM|nr:class I SAM-dependent methyltransferase [Aliidiomarina taiwanensis]RUO42950.1 hypothetical protein CWE15_05990 [Aliidiomarina taiwanensis]